MDQAILSWADGIPRLQRGLAQNSATDTIETIIDTKRRLHPINTRFEQMVLGPGGALYRQGRQLRRQRAAVANQREETHVRDIRHGPLRHGRLGGIIRAEELAGEEKSQKVFVGRGERRFRDGGGGIGGIVGEEVNYDAVGEGYTLD